MHEKHRHIQQSEHRLRYNLFQIIQTKGGQRERCAFLFTIVLFSRLPYINLELNLMCNAGFNDTTYIYCKYYPISYVVRIIYIYKCILQQKQPKKSLQKIYMECNLLSMAVIHSMINCRSVACVLVQMMKFQMTRNGSFHIR